MHGWPGHSFLGVLLWFSSLCSFAAVFFSRLFAPENTPTTHCRMVALIASKCLIITSNLKNLVRLLAEGQSFGILEIFKSYCLWGMKKFKKSSEMVSPLAVTFQLRVFSTQKKTLPEKVIHYLEDHPRTWSSGWDPARFRSHEKPNLEGVTQLDRGLTTHYGYYPLIN